MSKERIIKKLLEENVEPGVKYHSQLPAEISQWYVYTRNSGHRILCVLKKNIKADMAEADYQERLVSAPVKTVLRGYAIRDSFVIVDSEYDPATGFVAEPEDREFDETMANPKYTLSVGQLYLPGTTSWPEAAEYNYFSGNHELRFFVKNPSRYISEVISKMPVQLGLFTQGDIILLVYKFTDYKKHLVPVHGYSPFSIHLVPENMRAIPVMPAGDEHEEALKIHLVDADTGILKAARTVHLSPGVSAALCNAIIEQGSRPLPDDYNERLQKLDSAYPDNDSLLNHCIEKCTG